MQCVCGAHWCWSCERNFYVCDTFGGCEDDEGDESDPSDDEYDGEEPEVVEAAASSTSTPTPGTSTEETVTNGEASTTDNTQTTNLVLRRRRSVNLDRGSHGYWEGRGDFGDEPSNDEQENWGCPVSAGIRGVGSSLLIAGSTTLTITRYTKQTSLANRSAGTAGRRLMEIASLAGFAIWYDARSV
jgi:hypothetical protein